MKSRLIALMLILLTVAFGSAALADQATSDLLEKGVFAQETSGDLDAALKAYGRIIDQAEENRPFVARALYHMGECYLKKGDKAKALDMFQKVAARYADQTDAVAKARERIHGLAEAISASGRRELLDAETLTDVQKIDRMFYSWFRPESGYDAKSPAEKAATVESWMVDAQGDDFKARTRAIAALGNVAAGNAVAVLIDIVNEPMRNHRPKWMAVRALGEIGDPAAVPALIEQVDCGNWNTRVYAKTSLAQITGVYFADDKNAWRKW